MQACATIGAYDPIDNIESRASQLEQGFLLQQR